MLQVLIYFLVFCYEAYFNFTMEYGPQNQVPIFYVICKFHYLMLLYCTVGLTLLGTSIPDQTSSIWDYGMTVHMSNAGLS